MAWQPIGPHEEITIEELQERAQSIASQIMGMSQAQRSSQLRKLKNIDSTLWSIVKSLISDWRQQAKSQGQEQVLGQAFGKQGSWEEHLKGLPPRPKRRLILLD